MVVRDHCEARGAGRRAACAIGVGMPDDARPDWYRDIVASYDTVAEQYAADYYDELSRKPFDRELLTKFAGLMPNEGQVADIGCGPGHVARYVADLGVNAIGVDLSRSMVE